METSSVDFPNFIDLPSFVHLHCHSSFSLAEGTMSIEKLIGRAQELGMHALALTDRMNLFGAYQFSVAAKKVGIKPIIGCQIHCKGNLFADKNPLKGRKIYDKSADEYYDLILLVKNETGYRQLSKLISKAYLEVEPNQDPHVKSEWLIKDDIDGLFCLTGGLDGPIAKALLAHDHKRATQQMMGLKQIFGDDLAIEIQRHGLEKQDMIEGELIAIADEAGIPLAAGNDCYFLTPDEQEANEILLSIADKTTISVNERRRLSPYHYLQSPNDMCKRFEDLQDAITNTITIMKKCNFMLKSIPPQLPAFPVPEGQSEGEYLRILAEEGLKKRLDHLSYRPDDEVEREAFDKIYWDRLNFELEVITNAGFDGYFLIVQDFIVWALDHDVPVGPGRGSGVASLVAYSLSIIHIDPIYWDLLFERFLNPERVSLPDFDIDFCSENRDRVIEYVRDKYGRDKVGQIITYGTLQARAVIRDVARALEIPYGKADRLAKMIPFNPSKKARLPKVIESDPALQDEIEADEETKRLFDLAIKLEGMHRHASTHAGGVVVANNVLTDFVPLYRDPNSEMPLTQFSKDDVEQVGLVKFDFLGIRTLTIVSKAVELLIQNNKLSEDFDVNNIPLDDEKTISIYQDANTIGIFQTESPGMRQWLTALKPQGIHDVVAMIALYRPGPMDNIPTYVARRWGKEECVYPHPLTQQFLESTYGVPVYQEQVMRMLRVMAGFSLGEADQVRRAIGKKNEEELKKIADDFIQRTMKLNGLSYEEAAELFVTIDKFSGYGFNKSHAVAYGILSYQTAWLKANYKLEFYVAAMNQERKSAATEAIAKYYRDAKENKIDIQPISINHPCVEFEIDYHDNDKNRPFIRYAMGALKGASDASVQAIIDAFQDGGAFKDIYDFFERVPQTGGFHRFFEIIVRAGAFDEIEPNRHFLIENANDLILYGQDATQTKQDHSSLFGEDLVKNNRPKLKQVEDWDEATRLIGEAQIVGVFLTGHPLDHRQVQCRAAGLMKIEDFLKGAEAIEGQVDLCGIVTAVSIRNYERKIFTKEKKKQDQKISIKQVKDEEDKKEEEQSEAEQKEKAEEKIPTETRKMANIMFSDPTGIMEVTVFEIEDKPYLFDLKIGDAVVIEGKMRENKQGEKRFSTQRVESLDAYFDRKIHSASVELHDANEENFIAFKNIIYKYLEDGSGTITVFLWLQNGVKMKTQLDGYFKFKPGFKKALAELPFVSDISTI